MSPWLAPSGQFPGPLPFAFPEQGTQASLMPGFSEAGMARSLLKEEGKTKTKQHQKQECFLPALTLPQGTHKSTLLVVLKPEELGLPQPTLAPFYIVQPKKCLGPKHRLLFCSYSEKTETGLATGTEPKLLSWLAAARPEHLLGFP